MSGHATYRKAMKVYNVTRDNGNTNREQESQALSFLVSQLQKAHANPEKRQLYFDALYYNQKMWSALRASALDEEHEMPEDLKQNLLTLSLFVDKHIAFLLRDYEPKELDVLIDINRCLALGLQGITPEDAMYGDEVSEDQISEDEVSEEHHS